MNKIFLDMDNTIADFEGQFRAMERFDNEMGFFARLHQMESLTNLNELAKKGNIYIISASPNIQADIDKRQWLRVHLPNVPFENILFCRIGINKAQFIENKLNIKIDNTCILLDDYTKNLEEWKSNGGIGIKRISKYSPNKSKKWKGLEISKIDNIGRFV